MLGYLYWDPNPALLPFRLPLLGRPILWYGFLFALGFFVAYWILRYLLRSFCSKPEAKKVAERFTFYAMLGTIIGARLGDVLFYQSWSKTAKDPLSIIKVWEGGLASHGGAIGILIALYVLYLRLHKQFSYLRLLDLVVVPTAFVAVCIRIGNFINQEILGTVSSVPWAVIFAHPADGSLPIPRHPVQLYEAGFYLLTFGVLMLLWKKWRLQDGKIAGLFFVLIFGFRFIIEFFKEEQSSLIHTTLTMGQYLSIPLIALGCFLLWLKRDKR